jgi:hypothetical protein
MEKVMFDKNMEQIDVAASIQRLRTYELDGARVDDAVSIDEPNKGSIVGEGIIAFTAGLSTQNQEDVLHAFLFASLVANKKYPLESQGKEWYALFTEVMYSVGWLPTQKYYNDLNIGGNTVRMDKLVLEILGSVIAGVAMPGTATALMLKVAGDAINALKKRETALTLYERNMLDHGVGGMAAGTCTEEKGEVTLALGMVRFIRDNSSTKVLFVDWDTRSVKFYRGESVFRKVPYLVDNNREYIRERLGDNARRKIEGYEI